MGISPEGFLTDGFGNTVSDGGGVKLSKKSIKKIYESEEKEEEEKEEEKKPENDSNTKPAK